jgi:P-type conjugative transfer protein TrbJ
MRGALLVCLSAIALTAGNASGQFGVPQIVFDPHASASLKLQYAQLVRQGATAITQLRRAEETVRTLQTAAKRYTRLPLASFATRQSAFDRLFAGTTGLGYNNPALDLIFRRAFPEARVADPITGASAVQQNLVRRAAYALVMGSGQQGAQLREAVQTLETVKRMTSAASSQAEIAQAQASAGVLAVQEAQQARQLQVASVNQQAAMDAYRISRDAREDSLSALARARWDVREREIAELIERWKRRQQAPSGIWRPGARPPVFTPPIAPGPPPPMVTEPAGDGEF